VTYSATNLAPAVLLLIGFPIWDGVQVLSERLVFRPYPRAAWGSWLTAAWAVAMVFTVMQFAVGTIVHFEELGASFLAVGLPTIVYALLLAKLIRRLLPKSSPNDPESVLLVEFQANHREIYGIVFLLSLLPFVVFYESLTAPPQIFRLIWMGGSVVGFFFGGRSLWVHKALIVIGGPLTVALLVLHAIWFGAH